MLIKFFKLFLILLFYQNPLYSKSKNLNDFNSHHLSNYFSGLVAYENNDNFKALKFFESSKYLIKKHNSYLKKYIYSLVLEGKVKHATNEIKKNFTKNNSNFFEAHLILALDSLKKKNCVISLGGGGFLNKSIRKEILSNNISFWLKWSPKILLTRIKNSLKRPIAVNSSELELLELINKRSDIYSKALYKIECDDLTKNQIVNHVLKIYEN